MLSVDDAVRLILENCPTLAGETVDLASTLGLVLAEDARSEEDSPPFDKSMMDGYAVRAVDCVNLPRELRVIGEVIAGDVSHRPVDAGDALRIMTGAPLPDGADAVVRLEDTEAAGSDRVRLVRGALEPGTNVIRRGSLMQRGEVVIAAGRRVRPQELAVLAELGRASLRTIPRPSIAVLATGNELVPPGRPLGPGQIRNSNELMLVAQASRWGCRGVGLGIARDRLDELRETIARGFSHDVLVLTGGVSMGTMDLVPQVLAELGARQVFHKIHFKPGKPVWFGVKEEAPTRSGRTLIFALPGNPVSSMVCSELFVRPAVRRLAGIDPPEVARFTARLTRRHVLREDRPTYFPATISWTGEGPLVTPTDWKGSADLKGTLNANGVIAYPAGERTYEAGERVTVIPFGDEV